MLNTKTRKNLSALARLAAASLLLALGMTQTASAAAGVVTPVSFPATPTSNPGNLNMYEYVPTGVIPAGKPIVVVLHGCGQSGLTYAVQSGWTKIAEAKKLYLVIAEQKSGLTGNNTNGCFNWFEPGDNQRGVGEAASIVEMIAKFKSLHGLPANMTTNKAYVSGLSAGGAMAAVMLATYPDVFQGGAINSGIPYGCATNASTANSCMGTPGYPLPPTRTALQWGNLARAAFAWAGHKPDVAIFHGSADTTVTPARMNELMLQWTNYDALSTVPSLTTPLKGYPRNQYGTLAGGGVSPSKVQTVSVTGMGHGVAVDMALIPPGVADQCGTAGLFVLSVGLCSSYYSTVLWGI